MNAFKNPKLRFKEFKFNWNLTNLGEIFYRIKDRNNINNRNILTISAQKGLIKQDNFFTKIVSSNNLSGYYLISKNDFAYNKSYSNGYPMGAIKRLKNYDNGIVSPLYICFRTKENNFFPIFFEYYFDAGYINKSLSNIAQEGSRNHGLLNIGVNDFFNKVTVNFPGIEEQKKIAKFLTSVDNYIQNLKTQKEELEKYKTGIMQKIFSQQLRFKDVNGKDFPKWIKKEINTFIKEINTKTTKNNQFPVLSSTLSGIYLQSEYFDKQVASENNSGYKIVNRGNFTYRSMSDTGIFRFNIQNLVDKGIVSPAYPVFETVHSIVLPEYLYLYLNFTDDIKNQLIKSKQGGTRFALNISKFKKLHCIIPSIEEQKKIAEFLSSIDNLIEIKSKEIENAEYWKKGLMQQIFI